MKVIEELCAATSSPVFYQLHDDSVEAMKREVDAYLNRGWPNAGVKVALTPSGCAILHWLREQNVELRLATAVASVGCLLLADILETPWVTPSGSILERLGGQSKIALLTDMQAALDKQSSKTMLIPSASTPAELVSIALAGIRSAFIWDHAIDRFIDHETTRQFNKGFDTAWAQLAKHKD